ncbi:6350_t:CDS:2 [Funneliformis mosseae]|uniref:6350_t:CDS:1 n=1 Tax=Funneliformis mosseae TaxID=27381 RepID=A0A9N8VLE9_FUNMO|nr:6350_t:CDS:2 [Funneliformis mosseae]
MQRAPDSQRSPLPSLHTLIPFLLFNKKTSLIFTDIHHLSNVIMDNNNFAFTFNNLDSREERTLNKQMANVETLYFDGFVNKYLTVLPMTPSKPESFARQLYFHLDLGLHGEDEQKGKESFQPISSAIKVYLDVWFYSITNNYERAWSITSPWDALCYLYTISFPS